VKINRGCDVVDNHHEGVNRVPSSELASLSDVGVLLTDDERLIATTVRDFVGKRVRPNVVEWFETVIYPQDIAVELGAMGLLYRC
jgi:glutaryl-CoA dehydrogenase